MPPFPGTFFFDNPGWEHVSTNWAHHWVIAHFAFIELALAPTPTLFLWRRLAKVIHNLRAHNDIHVAVAGHGYNKSNLPVYSIASLEPKSLGKHSQKETLCEGKMYNQRVSCQCSLQDKYKVH